MDAQLCPDDTLVDATVRMADEAPNQSAKATSQDPLPVVLKAALTHVEKADRADKSATDHRTSAGLRFKELKDRVQAGEVGKVSWASYCAKYIPTLTQWTVDRYIAIAEGRLDELIREEVRKWREAWSSPGEDAAHAAHKAKQEAGDGAKSYRNADKRKAQNAKAQAKRRAKSSTIREANGGKASKPRKSPERAALERELAETGDALNDEELTFWIRQMQRAIANKDRTHETPVKKAA